MTDLTVRDLINILGNCDSSGRILVQIELNGRILKPIALGPDDVEAVDGMGENSRDEQRNQTTELLLSVAVDT